MSKLKELATENSLEINSVCPSTEKELEDMDKGYSVLSPVDFGKKYRYLVFRPSTLNRSSGSDSIDMNYGLILIR